MYEHLQSALSYGMQVRKREEAADHTSADLARQVAALDQKDRSASEKEKSLSSLTAELWAKVTPLHCHLVLPSAIHRRVPPMQQPPPHSTQPVLSPASSVSQSMHFCIFYQLKPISSALRPCPVVILNVRQSAVSLFVQRPRPPVYVTPSLCKPGSGTSTLRGQVVSQPMQTPAKHVSGPDISSDLLVA